MISPNTPPGTRVMCINTRDTSCAVAISSSGDQQGYAPQRFERCWSPSGTYSQFHVSSDAGQGTGAGADASPHPAQLAKQWAVKLAPDTPCWIISEALAATTDG